MVLDSAADTPLLLEAAEVPPVLEENAAGRSPFLLTCNHYGRLIPRALGDLGLPAGELTRHIAWDIGIAGVAEQLSKHLDAHLIALGYRIPGLIRRHVIDFATVARRLRTRAIVAARTSCC